MDSYLLWISEVISNFSNIRNNIGMSILNQLCLILYGRFWSGIPEKRKKCKAIKLKKNFSYSRSCDLIYREMLLDQQDCLTGEGSCCQAWELDFNSLDLCDEKKIPSQQVFLWSPHASNSMYSYEHGYACACMYRHVYLHTSTYIQIKLIKMKLFQNSLLFS